MRISDHTNWTLKNDVVDPNYSRPANGEMDGRREQGRAGEPSDGVGSGRMSGKKGESSRSEEPKRVTLGVTHCTSSRAVFARSEELASIRWKYVMFLPRSVYPRMMNILYFILPHTPREPLMLTLTNGAHRPR